MKDTLKTLYREIAARLPGGRSIIPPGTDWLIDIWRNSRDSPPFKTIFDVGANVGQTCIPLSKRYRRAEIRAFEPMSATYNVLKKNVAPFSRIIAEPFALGAQSGQGEAVIFSSLSQCNALRYPGDALPNDLPTETVNVDTLDQYCCRHGIESIDILKIDTEGYDLQVLQGAEKMLQEKKVRFIYIEVTFSPQDTLHTPFIPVYELLIRHGYHFLGLYEIYTLHYGLKTFTSCNALFVDVPMERLC